MSALDAALAYARRGYRVFPCIDKNRPLVKWRDLATTDPALLAKWWKRWPHSLVGTPTGEIDVVLDVDPPAGIETLDALGFPFAFETPTAHTPRGGLHAHFRVPIGGLRNTAGERGCGIGENLDWRGAGGYVLMPSAGSEYSWDPHLGLDVPMIEVPPELLPRLVERTVCAKAIQPCAGLSRYGEAALDKAARAIIAAPRGEQERTLNGEAFSIGTLCGAGALPADFARDVLVWAASKLVSYDQRRPWRENQLRAKVDHAFEAGMRQPREAHHV